MSLTDLECTCGTLRQSRNKCLVCPNCDTVQDTERVGDAEKRRRIPTSADRRFKLEWAKREREIYPNQPPSRGLQ